MKSLNAEGIRLDQKDKTKLSPTTINKYYKLLSTIFQKAYDWGYLIMNPCNQKTKNSYGSKPNQSVILSGRKMN